MTVADAIRRAAETLQPPLSDAPRLEARILLASALCRSDVWVFQNLQTNLSNDDARGFLDLVERRASGEPLAYLVGEREFFGRSFRVDPRVLVPRPETEVLVERAIALARNGEVGLDAGVVDVGTGSGVIAITVALEVPSARIVAADYSAAALELARLNVARYGLSKRVELVQGDVVGWLGRPAALILANLPYIPSGQLPNLPPAVQREPRLALDGGPDGLDLYRRLFRQAQTCLSPNGALLAEIAWDQGPTARSLAASSFPGRGVTLRPDLEGRDRVLEVGRQAEPAANQAL
jgi:release factor glutamine methyltransferase